MKPTQNIIHRATRGNKPINVLTWNVHEAFQSNFDKCNATFWLWQQDGLKDWNTKYRPVPTNHIMMDRTQGDRQIPSYVEMDLVLSQNKLAHFGLAQSIARALHIPIISLEHCLPPPNWPKRQLEQMKGMKGTTNCFITDFNRDQWLWNKDEAEVVYHCVDTEFFEWDGEEKENRVLSVANDYVNRNWCLGFDLYREGVKGLPVKLVGETPGLSEAAKDVEELRKFYCESTIFLNTSLISPIPTSLLEAASCGCACITTNNCAIGEFFTHGKTALFANTPEEIQKHAHTLLNDPEYAVELGINAAKMVREKCSKERFVSEWDSVFERTIEKGYLGNF